MTIHSELDAVPPRQALPPKTGFQQPENCPLTRCSAISMYEAELEKHRLTEAKLRSFVIRERALLRQKNDLIRQKEILSKESDHRLLNGLQIVVSLLSLQSRTAANTEAASQLAVAAERVATIGRVHRCLHSLDGVQIVAFKQYLKDLCRDFSTMLSSKEYPGQLIVVEGSEIELPAATAIPLSFIVNEMLTNAAKYGTGRITVRLEPNPIKGFALSVSNDGPILPEEFDPAACKGLGMKIIRSFIEQIGGEFRIGKGDENQGTQFTVLFS